MAPAAADSDGGHRRRCRNLALVSLFLDVCACGSALLLLWAWVRDASYGTSHLSPRFSATGFCNSESVDTQSLCYIFNYAAAFTFLVLMKIRVAIQWH